MLGFGGQNPQNEGNLRMNFDAPDPGGGRGSKGQMSIRSMGRKMSKAMIQFPPQD